MDDTTSCTRLRVIGCGSSLTKDWQVQNDEDFRTDVFTRFFSEQICGFMSGFDGFSGARVTVRWPFLVGALRGNRVRTVVILRVRRDAHGGGGHRRDDAKTLGVVDWVTEGRDGHAR